ncbi:hypothetical protein BAMA_15535 [Bacillus manliponensis]|uniref:Uncharacterized protein n=1 Tax=Bacillus manliponensis TaxID=574376 RepID=A0A073JSZ3_9BACI|nr:YpiB family protein [Bacillus manliponensis]KEK17367.1 hypothetical protein BAMA_15535 [Bacillus manliponensis]
MSNVSVEQKKKFLQWFLDNYLLKWRESMWILTYLLSNEILLKKVRFVEEAENGYPRALFISAQCVKTTPLLFYKNNEAVSENPERAFNSIRLNRDEDIYIELNFNDRYKVTQFLEVLEDETSDETDLVDKELQELESFIQEMQLIGRRQLIDRALDQRDEELFKKLVAN